MFTCVRVRAGVRMWWNVCVYGCAYIISEMHMHSVHITSMHVHSSTRMLIRARTRAGSDIQARMHMHRLVYKL